MITNTKIPRDEIDNESRQRRAGMVASNECRAPAKGFNQYATAKKSVKICLLT